MRRWLIGLLAGLVVVGTAVYLYFAAQSQPLPDHPFFAGEQELLVIAHQGGEWLRPSNTLVAFDNAVALGVDVLEMDVHGTADGYLVLIHDATVDRTTDGTGTVRDMTLAEIQALDAGYYWTDDDGQTFPYRGQGVTIPTLDELLDAHSQMRLNIEIKQREPSIAEQLCATLQARGLTEQALIASFHEVAMNEFRAACPTVATSMPQGEIVPFFVLSKLFLGATYQASASSLQVPEYRGGILPWGDLRVVNGRFVRDAQRHNMDVHIWTVNDPADMKRMIALGVDGIITDRPDLLLEMLGR